MYITLFPESTLRREHTMYPGDHMSNGFYKLCLTDRDVHVKNIITGSVTILKEARSDINEQFKHMHMDEFGRLQLVNNYDLVATQWGKPNWMMEGEGNYAAHLSLRGNLNILN